MEATDDLMSTPGRERFAHSSFDDLSGSGFGDWSRPLALPASVLLPAYNLLQHLAFAGVERILSELGDGSFGKVYCCEVAGFKQPIAVKVGRHGNQTNPTISRELALLPDISHPNIVCFLGVVETPPVALFLEYCSGGSLSELVHEEGRALFQEWSLTSRVRTMLDTAEAMAYLHARDILHRDLKPSNALLATPPGRFHVPPVKLADLGLARLLPSDLNSRLTQTVGTAAYMSPEMILGESYDETTDVYSWAIMLHEVCSGKKPYSEHGPGAVARLLLNICTRAQRPDLALIPRAADTATICGDITCLLGCCWEQDAPDRPTAEHVAGEMKRILSFAA